MFVSTVKDFVRNVIFPRVNDLVPSSTREGAEAFLKSIRRTHDVLSTRPMIYRACGGERTCDPGLQMSYRALRSADGGAWRVLSPATCDFDRVGRAEGAIRMSARMRYRAL
jgi:hypothetical protein